ncbi:hypothetical protein V1527DRAFT_498879 [Lipomyces starkeyi]
MEEDRKKTSWYHNMMEHSDLLDIGRRPLSPDTRLEAPASRAEYERVEEILAREEAKYGFHIFISSAVDSMRNVAIVVAPPSPLHGCIVDENTSRGRTTSARDVISMVAVEIGLSQLYASLRAAISWSVCALGCRLGLAMFISEKNAAAEEAEDDFRDQSVQHPYGPLVRHGVTCQQDEECTRETLLEPSRSSTIVENGEFIGHNFPKPARVHLLIGQEVQATPVNLFHRDWFEEDLNTSMILTAVERVRRHFQPVP